MITTLAKWEGGGYVSDVPRMTMWKHCLFILIGPETLRYLSCSPLAVGNTLGFRVCNTNLSGNLSLVQAQER